MPQRTDSAIRQELASLTAEAEQKKCRFLAGLNASETVLFHGVDHRPMCSVRERQELRRHTRQVLHKLLDMGVTTILVEDSSLYGHYALEELLRQRRKHHFSLYVFHREDYPYRWLHRTLWRGSTLKTEYLSIVNPYIKHGIWREKNETSLLSIQSFDQRSSRSQRHPDAAHRVPEIRGGKELDRSQAGCIGLQGIRRAA